MVNVVAVTSDRHASKGWRRPEGCSFAATEMVAPLVGSEFAAAALSMPIGFTETSGQYAPVALMSVLQGRNMFVGPQGQWLGAYAPAVLRSYPFLLGRVESSDTSALCVDEGSGLVVDPDADTQKFFEADGAPSATIKAIMEFLQQTERHRAATSVAIAALAAAGVIKPWALTVTIGKQQIPVNGLHCVDEAALNALNDEAFLTLRKSSALVLAYTQLVSMGNVGVFHQLTLVQQQLVRPSQPEPITIHSDMIRFD